MLLLGLSSDVSSIRVHWSNHPTLRSSRWWKIEFLIFGDGRCRWNDDVFSARHRPSFNRNYHAKSTNNWRTALFHRSASSLSNGFLESGWFHWFRQVYSPDDVQLVDALSHLSQSMNFCLMCFFRVTDLGCSRRTLIISNSRNNRVNYSNV